MDAPPLHRRVTAEVLDTPFGCWHIGILMPHPLLAAGISDIFYVRGRSQFPREKILPAGTLVLLFNLGPTQGLVDADDSARVTGFDGAFVSGLQRRHLVTEALDESHLVGVRLSPLMAFRLLGLPMAELADAVVEGRDVVRELSDLTGRMADAPTVEACFGHLEAWLLKRWVDGPAARPMVDAAHARLNADGGLTPISELARDLGVSPRHLAQRFTEQVGFSPKLYARILRFERALGRLGRVAEGAAPEPMTAIAHDSGYFDQAHFNREFRAMTGATPGEFLRDAAPGGASMIVAEAPATDVQAPVVEVA